MCGGLRMADVEWIDFRGCYDEGWKGLISEASFSHPAKAARGLIRKIFTHMEQQGWLPPRSRVLDVFGGIGTTSIEGASRGHECVSIELEERFYLLALENFALHQRVWEASGDPLPVILHGDSRKAAELVRGYFAAVVSSPPYNGPFSQTHPGTAGGTRGIESPDGGFRRYGNTPGQLEGLPDGNMDAVLSSPPYAETAITGQGNFQSAKCPDSQKANTVRAEGYSADAVVGSPPFCDGSVGDKRPHGGMKTPIPHTGTSPPGIAHYGATDGQLGNLKEGDVDAVVSSPPFLGARAGTKASVETAGGGPCAERINSVADGDRFGQTPGQLGVESPETFWLAARAILEQVHMLLKSGGEPVPDGNGVDFCDCTCQHS